MMKREKRYTVITGASSGIGYEIAKVFASKGKNLVIVARRKERLENLRSEIGNLYPRVDVIIKVTDLSKKEKVYKFYEELEKYFIETWINNAGIGNYDYIHSQKMNKIMTMLDLNIKALTILSTLYVMDYREKKDTQLINVSSAGGYTIVPNAVTYCASKFYVSAFTEGLAWEMKETKGKMKVKLLAPAATQTEFGKKANNVDEYDYDKVFKKYHSGKQVAEFSWELYISDKTVGIVDREKFTFILKDSIFLYSRNSFHNQKLDLEVNNDRE